MPQDTPVFTSPQEMRTHMTRLRRLIARDHAMYKEYNSLLWPWYPTEHAAVKSVLMARSRWYNGEILRAKHNLARYIRGEPLKPVLWIWSDTVKRVDDEISELNNALIDWIEAGDKPARSEEHRRLMNELTKSMLDSAVSALEYSRNTLERTTYGG